MIQWFSQSLKGRMKTFVFFFLYIGVSKSMFMNFYHCINLFLLGFISNEANNWNSVRHHLILNLNDCTSHHLLLASLFLHFCLSSFNSLDFFLILFSSLPFLFSKYIHSQSSIFPVVIIWLENKWHFWFVLYFWFHFQTTYNVWWMIWYKEKLVNKKYFKSNHSIPYQLEFKLSLSWFEHEHEKW